MVTCAELARRIDELEALLERKMADTVEQVYAKIKCDADVSAPDLASMKVELDDLVTSVTHLNSLVEEARAENKALVAANKALTSQNDALTKKIAEMEQYSRINNVELKGIPCTQGEDCTAIVKAIGTKVSCTISDTDIDVIHRVPTKAGTSQNIIARFCSRSKKQEFVSKARKARLNTKDLDFPGPDNYPVYINDHLTPDNKRLFAKALAMKKEKGWLHLWTDNGHIEARQTNDSRVFRIASEADFSVFR